MSTQVEILTSRDTEDNQTPHLVTWAGEIYKRPLPYPGALWLPESYYMSGGNLADTTIQATNAETELDLEPVDQLKRTSGMMFKLAAWGATLSIAAATILGKPETTSASGLTLTHSDKIPLPSRTAATLSQGVPTTPFQLVSEDLTSQCVEAHETNSVTGPNSIPIKNTEIIFDPITFKGDTEGLTFAQQQGVQDAYNYVASSFSYNFSRAMGIHVTSEVLPIQTLPHTYQEYVAMKNANKTMAYTQYQKDFNYTFKTYDPKEGIVRIYNHVIIPGSSTVSDSQLMEDFDGTWGGVNQTKGYGETQIYGFEVDPQLVATYVSAIMHEDVHGWGGNHLDVALQDAPRFQGKYDPLKNLMVPYGDYIQNNPQFNAANVYNLCTRLVRLPGTPRNYRGL